MQRLVLIYNGYTWGLQLRQARGSSQLSSSHRAHPGPCRGGGRIITTLCGLSWPGGLSRPSHASSAQTPLLVNPASRHASGGTPSRGSPRASASCALRNSAAFASCVARGSPGRWARPGAVVLDGLQVDVADTEEIGDLAQLFADSEPGCLEQCADTAGVRLLSIFGLLRRRHVVVYPIPGNQRQ